MGKIITGANLHFNTELLLFLHRHLRFVFRVLSDSFQPVFVGLNRSNS